MKKYIITVITLLLAISSFALIQVEKDQNNLNQRSENCIKTYRLFATENMWHFIKLNTRTGQIWQIQFDDKEKNRLETAINDLSLIEKQEEVDNRFTLYSTQRIWTFILLDQINGKIWQAEWSIKPEERKIIPI